LPVGTISASQISRVVYAGLPTEGARQNFPNFSIHAAWFAQSPFSLGRREPTRWFCLITRVLLRPATPKPAHSFLSSTGWAAQHFPQRQHRGTDKVTAVSLDSSDVVRRPWRVSPTAPGSSYHLPSTNTRLHSVPAIRRV